MMEEKRPIVNKLSPNQIIFLLCKEFNLSPYEVSHDDDKQYDDEFTVHLADSTEINIECVSFENAILNEISTLESETIEYNRVCEPYINELKRILEIKRIMNNIGKYTLFSNKVPVIYYYFIDSNTTIPTNNPRTEQAYRITSIPRLEPIMWQRIAERLNENEENNRRS